MTTYCMNCRFAVGWVATAWLLIAGTAFSAELYVAPDGRDANPGTKSEPVASIAKARDAVRLRTDAEPVRARRPLSFDVM